MNAKERKDLLALLAQGDILAAYSYVEGAGAASKPSAKKAAGVQPLKRTYPKGPFSLAKKLIATRTHLGVAPCGCTLYPDTALMCAACIAARSPEACRALIVEHKAALDAFDQRMGFGFRGYGAGRSYRSPSKRDFMISPHNGYYGERDKHEIVTEEAA